MDMRYDEPARSLILFEEVVKIQPNHYEACLKISWLTIQLNQYQRVREILQRIVDSNDSTIHQKQRAYNNVSCSWLFQRPPDFVAAETSAFAGIKVDGKGTNKLWENYAASLKHQGRLEEARDAYANALLLNPMSENALQRHASVEKHYKAQRRDQRDNWRHTKSKSVKMFITGSKRVLHLR